jgi:hypothetical protein
VSERITVKLEVTYTVELEDYRRTIGLDAQAGEAVELLGRGVRWRLDKLFEERIGPHYRSQDVDIEVVGGWVSDREEGDDEEGWGVL